MERMFYIPKLYTSILLESMHSAKVPKGWSFPSHRHAYYEFIYCAAGSMEQWVNGNPYLLQAGDAIVVKSGLYHRTAELPTDAEFFVFHFDVDMKEVQSIFQLVVHPQLSAGREGGSLDVGGWVDAFMSEFRDLLAPDVEPLPSVRLLRMQMRILEFVCLLAEELARDGGAGANSRMSPAQIALAHEVAHRLELHKDDRMPIQHIAREMGFHRSYVSNCFKGVYGMSPREYAAKLKLRSAKQLLQHTNDSIEAIAARLDFSSPAHFSKFFQTNEGMSPLKYRNRLPGR